MEKFHHFLFQFIFFFISYLEMYLLFLLFYSRCIQYNLKKKLCEKFMLHFHTQLFPFPYSIISFHSVFFPIVRSSTSWCTLWPFLRLVLCSYSVADFKKEIIREFFFLCCFSLFSFSLLLIFEIVFLHAVANWNAKSS